MATPTVAELTPDPLLHVDSETSRLKETTDIPISIISTYKPTRAARPHMARIAVGGAIAKGFIAFIQGSGRFIRGSCRFWMRRPMTFFIPAALLGAFGIAIGLATLLGVGTFAGIAGIATLPFSVGLTIFCISVALCTFATAAFMMYLLNDKTNKKAVERTDIGEQFLLAISKFIKRICSAWSNHPFAFFLLTGASGGMCVAVGLAAIAGLGAFTGVASVTAMPLSTGLAVLGGGVALCTFAIASLMVHWSHIKYGRIKIEKTGEKKYYDGKNHLYVDFTGPACFSKQVAIAPMYHPMTLANEVLCIIGDTVDNIKGVPKYLAGLVKGGDEKSSDDYSPLT